MVMKRKRFVWCIRWNYRCCTGNLTDFDKRGGKPFGLMRGITGTIDAATGLTDLDRRANHLD